MALHQKVSVGSGISIEFHAGSAGEQFIGQNPSGPLDAPIITSKTVISQNAGKQFSVTTPLGTRIVNPA